MYLELYVSATLSGEVPDKIGNLVQIRETREMWVPTTTATVQSIAKSKTPLLEYCKTLDLTKRWGQSRKKEIENWLDKYKNWDIKWYVHKEENTQFCIYDTNI